MDKKADTEQLISIIKQHEAIWNKNANEYHKKTSKEVAWNKVCEELLQGWNELDEEQKIFKQGEIKKRWNNIRDYYKKDLSLQLNVNRQPIIKRNKYMFSKQLEFLRPVLRLSQSSYSVKEEKTASDDETEEIYLEESYSTDSETTHLLKRKKILESNDLEDSNAEEFVAVAARRSETEEDSDLLFLKSLLPDMKMMSYSQKIDFKMDILKLCKQTFENNEDVNEVNDSKNPLK